MTDNATIRCFALVTTAVILAGCGGMNFGTNPEPPPLAPAPAARALAPQARSLADMAGRWMLASPGGGTCSMNFSGVPGAVEGTIAPEGGCPGKFFTSRRWMFDQDGLVIRNHTGDTLARLAMPAPGRFEGQATTGEALSLTR
jgi:Protease inhibitor Inh